MNAVLLRAGLVLVLVWSGARLVAADDEESSVADAPSRITRVAHEAFFEFGDEELRFRSVFELRSSGPPIAAVRFTIPEDVQIDTVEARNLERYEVDPDAYELRVALTTRPGGLETITIVGHIGFDPASPLEAVLLPVLEPVDAERETGSLHLFAPPGLNVAVDREIASGVVPIVARPEPIPAGTRHVMSWAYHRRPIELLVETSHDPLRMTAAVTTQAMVHPKYVELHSRVAYGIESGQTDLFRIAVPPAIAEQARVEPVGGVAVAQITRGEPLEDEWVPWTIVTREPQRGSVAFDVRSELAPISADRPLVLIAHEAAGADHAGDGATRAGRRVTVTPVRVLDPHASPENLPALRRVEGQFTAFSKSGLAVQIGPAAGDVHSSQPDVAIAEFPSSQVAEHTRTSGDETGLVGSFQYDEQHAAWELSWSKATPPASVLHIPDGRVEIAIPAAGSADVWANYRCSYTVLSARISELLVELPSVGDASLQSILAVCDGQPVPVERDSAAGEGHVLYRVRLAAEQAVPESIDKPHRLTLMFRLKLDGLPFRGFGSPLELPLPRIGQAGTVVENLEAVLWVPRGFALVGTPIGFVKPAGKAGGRRDSQPAPAAEQAGSVFPAAGRAYVFRRTGADDLLVVNWWNMRLATWILSAAVLVAALVLRPTSWRNRLTVVVWICFGVAMFAVAVPDAVAHGIFAARFGLIAGLVLWLLGTLRVRGAASARSSSAASATVPLAPESGPGLSATPQTPSVQRAA